MAKVCSLCKINKPLEEFASHKSTKDKKNSYCRECMKGYAKRYREQNKDKIQQYVTSKAKHIKEQRKQAFAERYKNPEYKGQHLARGARWRREKESVYKQGQLNWRKANPIKLTMYSAYHRSRRKRATPYWLGELDKFVFEEAYALRVKREEVTGIKWEIDHIIPISGKLVCGLHVWNNLQVIPATLNRSKFNKYTPL